MSELPEALRLADALGTTWLLVRQGKTDDMCDEFKAAAELRRQHSEIEQLKAERDSACKLVVEMHNAATGSTEGPRRGVVEDIADLKAERDALRTAIRFLFDHGAYLTERVPDHLQAAIDAARGEV